MRARRNLTCIAKRRYTAMPKSVDPAQPAQAGLRCLLSGTDRCDENGGNRRCAECSLSVRSAELVSFFTNFRTLPWA